MQMYEHRRVYLDVDGSNFLVWKEAKVVVYVSPSSRRKGKSVLRSENVNLGYRY